MFRPSRAFCGSSWVFPLFLMAALCATGGSTASAAYTVTDFAVDPAHATLGDLHEVASPLFNNFQLTIYGTFDTSQCYEVSIKHEGGSVNTRHACRCCWKA